MIFDSFYEDCIHFFLEMCYLLVDLKLLNLEDRPKRRGQKERKVRKEKEKKERKKINKSMNFTHFPSFCTSINS